MGEREEFCQVEGNACVCGRVGKHVWKCRLHIAPERVARIMATMREKYGHDQRNPPSLSPKEPQ